MKRRRTAYDLSIAEDSGAIFPLSESQAPYHGDISITRLRFPAQFDMSGRLEVKVLDELHGEPITTTLLDPTHGNPNDLHGVSGNKHNVVDDDISTTTTFSTQVEYRVPSIITQFKLWVESPGIVDDTDQVQVQGKLGNVYETLGTFSLTTYNSSLAEVPALTGKWDNTKVYDAYVFNFTWATSGGISREGIAQEFYLFGLQEASPISAVSEPTVDGTFFTSGTLNMGATYTLDGGVYKGEKRSGFAAENRAFTDPARAKSAIQDLFLKAVYATSTTSNQINELTLNHATSTVENTWGAELIVEVTGSGTSIVLLDVTTGGSQQQIHLVRFFEKPGLYRLNEWTEPYIYLPPGSYTMRDKLNVAKVGLVSHVSLGGVRPTLAIGDKATLTMQGFYGSVQLNELMKRRLRFEYDDKIVLRGGVAVAPIHLNDVHRISVYLEPSITNHVTSHAMTGSISMAEDTLIARTFYVDDFQDDKFFSFVQQADDVTNSSTLTSNKSSAIQFKIYLDTYDMIRKQFVRKPAVIPAGDFADLRMVVQS